MPAKGVPEAPNCWRRRFRNPDEPPVPELKKPDEGPVVEFRKPGAGGMSSSGMTTAGAAGDRDGYRGMKADVDIDHR